MNADGLWVPHARRQPRIYQPRQRRDCLGELIQIDSSHHDWFEGRAPKCCLLVYVDDATGRLMHLRFCQSVHRTVSESSPELDDIFARQTLRTLSKSLTLQYDKILYLVEPTEENSRIAGEKILTFDYPDGTLTFRQGSRILENLKHAGSSQRLCC